jgi:hypothetical protein
VRRGVLGALIAAAALAAPGGAGAVVGDDVRFDPPQGDAQRLTVTMFDETGGSVVVLYATYREVPPDTPTAGACASTMAENRDARLFDGVPAGPAPYRISRSVELPLRIFAVCVYRARDGSTDPAQAALSSVVVAGQYRSSSGGPAGGGTGADPKLSLRFRPAADGRFAFYGRCSRRTGEVSLQRSARGRPFRTVARTHLKRGRFTFTRHIRPGERYRVALRGTRARSGIVSFG